MTLTTQPLAKLGDLLKKEEPQIDTAARTRDIEKTLPIYIQKLSLCLNSYTKAGELIGMTGGAIKSILDKNESCVANELAARYVWERDFADKMPRKITAVIRFEDQHLFSIQTMMKSLGVKMIVLGTMED